MKKSRQSWRLILATVLVTALMLFSACGKTSNEPTSQPPKEDGQAADQKGHEELKPVELTWYYSRMPMPDNNMVFEAANKIIGEKINAKVNFMPIDPGSYDQKMQVKIASSEPFDLCFTANWLNNYYQNVARGAFLPLDDLLDKYAPNLKKLVPEKMWNATKVNGKIYGAINYQISAMTNGLMIKKDLVNKYKLDVNSIKALKDIEPFLETIKQNEDGVIPIAYYANPGSMLGYNLASLGFDEIGGRNVPGVIRLTDNSLKVINQFETPEFKQFVTLIRNWYEKGYIPQDAISIKDMTNEIKAGKVAVMHTGNYKPGGDIEASNTYGVDFIQIPIGKSWLLTSSIVSTMTAISRTSANPDRAMMLLELMNTDKELYNLICFGIEDVHYKKIGENRIEVVKDVKHSSAPWMMGCTFNAYLLPGQPDDVWEQTKKINEEAQPSPLLGFSFNPEPVNSEIAQATSAVKEFLPALDTGSVNPDEQLPKFLDKLKDAGIEKIITEMQEQIDNWKKTK